MEEIIDEGWRLKLQKNRIYKLWWQGMDDAPPIVKVCHNSLLRNYDSETQEIILLDKNNIFDYVSLPDYLMRKFKDGKISITHLSDIIRSMLLKRTGGLWTDATMFYSKPISEDVFDRDFFTMKNPAAHADDITSKWECFFIEGQSDFPLFGLLEDFWLEYWKREDALITYLLTDHLFYASYHENIRVRTAIDKCPSFYYRIDYFQRILNEEYNEKQFNEIIRNEPYIKMSYKFPLTEKSERGNLTFYGKLLKDYL